MDVFEYLLLLLVFFVGILGGGAVVLDWTYAGPKQRLSPVCRCADPPAGSQRSNRGNTRAACPEHNEHSAVFPAILLVLMRLSAAALVLLVLILPRPTVRVFGER